MMVDLLWSNILCGWMWNFLWQTPVRVRIDCILRLYLSLTYLLRYMALNLSNYQYSRVPTVVHTKLQQTSIRCWIFCVAWLCTSHCGSENIWFPLPDDDSETPSDKKHPLPVAKGTYATSKIKEGQFYLSWVAHVCDYALLTYVKLPMTIFQKVSIVHLCFQAFGYWISSTFCDYNLHYASVAASLFCAASDDSVVPPPKRQRCDTASKFTELQGHCYSAVLVNTWPFCNLVG